MQAGTEFTASMNQSPETNRSEVAWAIRAGFVAHAGAILIFIGGCGSPSGPEPQAGSPDEAIVPPTHEPISATPQVLPVYVQVIKVNLPLGTFTQNPRVWELLSPVQMDDSDAQIYSINGLRTGSADIDEWSKLLKLINKKGVTFENIFCQIAAAQPAAIPVQQNIQEELLSVYMPPAPMALRSYNSCDNTFMIAAKTDTQTGETLLDIQPVVQLGMVTFNRGSGAVGIVQGSTPTTEYPGNIHFHASVKLGQFFVLAPDTSARNLTTIGPAFLSQTDAEPQGEMVLFFVPLQPSAVGH